MNKKQFNKYLDQHPDMKEYLKAYVAPFKTYDGFLFETFRNDFWQHERDESKSKNPFEKLAKAYDKGLRSAFLVVSAPATFIGSAVLMGNTDFAAQTTRRHVDETLYPDRTRAFDRLNHQARLAGIQSRLLRAQNKPY